MNKVVIPNYRFSNWSRGQSKPGSWKIVLEYDPKDVPKDIVLTEKAKEVWKKEKSIFGYANFRGLKTGDILSIISAARRSEVNLGASRMGWVCSYKIKDR
ncbi:MAG: hypothetical protein WC503_00820 [Candidatus Shapirobacteria bacterium]